ncbi:MAG: flavin reductase [Frankiaceae bacterium]|nr:flavin reductase [Frankiaceae bacterium]MDQ1633310.1 flavin reductase [Frankiaceae bacterium]MDQ1648740.1 flavin reductase [Frankiaceae bacterium]
MATDPGQYRRVVGRFATGVTVATTRDENGTTVSLTANAFASVSLDPALALLSVQRTAAFHRAVLASGFWGVSILAEGHEALSRFHASKVRHELDDSFEGVATMIGPATGVTLVADAVAVIECRTTATYPGGDHTLLIGSVESASVPDAAATPLVFYEGTYRSLETGLPTA